MLALPTLDNATLLGWDQAMAKSKGIYGFDSLDARSRPFNMIRAKLHELRTERGWRLFGVVSATPKVGKSFIAANVAASLSRDPALSDDGHRPRPAARIFDRHLQHRSQS